MLRKTLFASLIASSAITLALAQPAAAASTSDRAREAIAAAEAKVHTAENLGATSDAPRDAADARAALASAKEDFAHGDREVAGGERAGGFPTDLYWPATILSTPRAFACPRAATI